jgi:hypothetical protein
MWIHKIANGKFLVMQVYDSYRNIFLIVFTKISIMQTVIQ